jgi:WD40 repeat protein
MAVREPSRLRSLKGHDGRPILSCGVWRGDDAGSWRAVGGSLGGALTVWDALRHQRVAERRAPLLSQQCCAAVFRNGTLALTTSLDGGTLVVQDLETGQALFRLLNATPGVPTLLCCSIFANETHAIGGCNDGTLKVWDLRTSNQLYAMRGHTGRVLCCAVLGCSMRAVSGGEDGTVIVWDLENRGRLFQLSGHTSEVLCCDAQQSRADGASRAVSGSADGRVKVWDLDQRRALCTMYGHTGPVHCCAMFGDGRYAVTGGADATLRIWNARDGSALYRNPFRGHAGPVRCCAVFLDDDDDTRLLSGGDDGTLQVWELPPTTTTTTPTGGFAALRPLF